MVPQNPWQPIDEREGSGRLDTWSEYLCVSINGDPDTFELAICRNEVIGPIPVEWFDDEGNPLPEYADASGELKLPEFYEERYSGGIVRTKILSHDGEYLFGELACDETYGPSIVGPTDDDAQILEAFKSLGWFSSDEQMLLIKVRQFLSHRPYLDFYEVDGEMRWNWKVLAQTSGELVSQEFLSEQDAVEAWNSGKLVWEAPPSY
jgi:hypothetical protein